MSVRTRLIPLGALRDRSLAIATIGGITAGMAYTLSPLTVWFAVGALFLGRALVRDLDPTERRVVLAIFVVAIVLRLLLLAGLFLAIDHSTTPFGSLFGDEEYFKRRSLWLRSMALGVNISEADRSYALEGYSETSYLYFLAFVQMLVGDAPYGVHLLSLLAYIAGSVWLFRFCRRAFGAAPAVLAFTGVLFLPTLFFWSVSALRESVHFLLTVAAVVGMSDVLASSRPRDRILGIVVAGAAMYAIKDLRIGSMVILAASLLLGSAATFAITRWRRLVITAAAAACIVSAAASAPGVQDRLLNALRTTALAHQGHAWTPGVHYKVLEPRFYQDRTGRTMTDMTAEEGARYVVRALFAAAFAPMPWQARTPQLQVYLVEHIIWLAMALLLPVSVWVAARRHAAAAFIMAAYIALMFSAIALRSGNIGTLVRHRGLVLPFVICLSAVFVCHVLARVVSRAQGRRPHRWR